MAVEIRKEDAPGVYRGEVNEAGIRVTPLGTRNVANVGVFAKGRTNTRILIRSQDDLLKYLGEGDLDNLGADWYGLYDLLEETDRVYVVRVTTDPANDADKMKYAGLLLDGAGSATANPVDEMSTTDLLADISLPVGKGNTSDFILPIEKETVSAGAILFSYIEPSASGNNVGVKVESNNKPITVVAPDWTGTPATLSVGDLYKDANDNVWKVLIAGTVDSTEPTWEASPVPGEIQVDGGVTWVSVLEDDERDVLSLKDKFPNSWKIMHKVEVFLKAEEDTTFGSSPSEEFFVTFDETVAPSGASLFAPDVINGFSEYVYVKLAPLTIPDHSAYDGSVYDTIVSMAVAPVALSGGQDGKFTTSNADYITQMKAGWSLFRSKEYSQWNIAFVPTDASIDATFQIAKQANVYASQRVLGLVVGQCDRLEDVRKEQVVLRAKSAFAGLANPTRIAYYSGWDRRFDPFRGKRIYLPKAIEGARAMLKTSRIKRDFDAPAGTEVGVCKGFEQNVEWSTEDAGYLYSKNINVSLTKENVSVLWGQKTAQLVEEPRDRINVRRALDKIGQDLEQKGNSLIWQSINTKLVERLYSLFDRDLSVKQGTGYFNTLEGVGYRIVIDTSRAGQNRLDVKIQVKIVNTLEWLGIEIAVVDGSTQLENA